MPAEPAERLWSAACGGCRWSLSSSSTEQQLRRIAVGALQEDYFKDCGRRAQGLEVEFTDIDCIELDLWGCGEGQWVK
ncbi:hypothetical protein [Actinacidiphila paucisporea]|uniref:hypothetical protein n=1 Tax=Actinacidiphila paucisporea TaxID=310782 RepID=UPI00190EBB7A|nr:hypothetical protein [Actinacidiphila paucisporea]